VQTEKPTILIAEDNEIDLFLIREALDQAGLLYEAEVAGTGQEALSCIHRSTQHEGKPLTAILLDLNLVTHTGIEVLELVRENTALLNTPIVILTSSNAPADRRKAEALGVSAFLVKPMDLDEWTELGRQLKQLFVRS
jgi:CheY-like chemotaxis protein